LIYSCLVCSNFKLSSFYFMVLQR